MELDALTKQGRTAAITPWVSKLLGGSAKPLEAFAAEVTGAFRAEA